MDRNLRIRMLFDATEKVTGPLKAIVGGSRAASAALKDTRDKLKGVEAAQADLREFRSLKTGLTQLEAKGQEAQARVAALARQIDAADTPTKKLTADFNKAKREAAALGDETRVEAERLQLLRAKLGDAGIATSALVSHERRLRTEAAGLNRELAEQEKRLLVTSSRAERLASARGRFSKMQGVSSSMATGGVTSIATGMAAEAPIVAAYGQARDFEAMMTTIAQKAGLSREEARQMGLQLMTAAKAANQLPEDLQAGVDALSGFGLDPRKAIAMMAPIGKTATAYKAEISDLSAASFAAIDNLKVPIGETQRILDMMAAAGKAGAFEVKDMAAFFPSLTASAQALGQKGAPAVADIAAALQIVRKGAGDAASAGTNLENLLQKISAPLTNKNFAKFGVDLPNALKKAYAEGKTPIEAITELTNKALKGDLSRLGYLFEDAQVQQALRPLIQNLDEYRRIRTEAGNSSGVVDQDFAERLNDAAEAQKRFTIGARELGTSLGGLLLPAATELMAKGTAVANMFSAWSAEHPRLAKYLLMTVAIGGGLLILFGGLAIGIAGLIAPFAALSAVAGFFNLAMLPTIGLVLAGVAAVALLAAGAYLLYENWSSIVTMFKTIGSNIMNGLVDGITGRINAVKSMILGIGSKVAGWFKGVLGIHSPSRVFRGFGGNIMDGLAIGIDDRRTEPVRRINSAAGQLTTALAVGMAAPAIASAPVGPLSGAAQIATAPARVTNTYHITISGVRDDADLEARLRTMLERIDRDRQARDRSSFHDRADGEDR